MSVWLAEVIALKIDVRMLRLAIEILYLRAVFTQISQKGIANASKDDFNITVLFLHTFTMVVVCRNHAKIADK